MSGADEPKPLSRDAASVLRVLRMYGAKPEQVVREALLASLWTRHEPRLSPERLTAGVAELVAAGRLRRAFPDGVQLPG